MKKAIILLFSSVMLSCDHVPYPPADPAVVEHGGATYEQTMPDNTLIIHIENDNTVGYAMGNNSNKHFIEIPKLDSVVRSYRHRDSMIRMAIDADPGADPLIV